jgi:hypothetical protein
VTPFRPLSEDSHTICPLGARPITASNLDAAVKVTASDGEWRVIGSGEILLVEDTRGNGHVSQAVDGKFRHSVFNTLD